MILTDKIFNTHLSQVYWGSRIKTINVLYNPITNTYRISIQTSKGHKLDKEFKYGLYLPNCEECDSNIHCEINKLKDYCHMVCGRMLSVIGDIKRGV